MKKLHIVSLFSLILSGSFYFFWSLTREIGIFMLWIPENLHNQLGIEKEKFVQSLGTLFHRADYESVWQFTVGNPQDVFMYIAILFALVCIVSFALSFKKEEQKK